MCMIFINNCKPFKKFFLLLKTEYRIFLGKIKNDSFFIKILNENNTLINKHTVKAMKHPSGYATLTVRLIVHRPDVLDCVRYAGPPHHPAQPAGQLSQQGPCIHTPSSQILFYTKKNKASVGCKISTDPFPICLETLTTSLNYPVF